MTEPPAIIRPAQPADVPRILDIIRAIYADYGDVLDTDREDTHLQNPLAHFRAAGGELWVADCAGIVAGSAGLRFDALAPAPGSPKSTGPGEPVFPAEIKTVYVAHDFRRRGLARRLVATALDLARARRVPSVGLWSDTRFTEAHRLYESLGFRRLAERRVAITNTFREYAYLLDLDRAGDPAHRSATPGADAPE